ncbi:MAG: zf-HC2 domain-containing protein [Betaproteobacteria bacterium]
MLHRLTHVLSCREAARLVSEAQDRPLTVTERVKLRLHLFVCSGCSRFARQIEFLRDAVARFRT